MNERPPEREPRGWSDRARPIGRSGPRAAHLVFVVALGLVGSGPTAAQATGASGGGGASTTKAADTPSTAVTGILKVKSPIPGASVWIDHELVGEAPITRYIPVGPHTVRLSVDGFDPFVRKIEVKQGSTAEVTATFVPGQGTVEFAAEPGGGKVVVDGKESWPLPVRLPAMTEGAHRYRIEAPGAEPMEGEFTFQKSKNLLIFQRLPSSAGRFDLRSEPPAARVWLDGEERGLTPLELSGIPAGKHVVRLSLDGYGDVFRRLDTSKGEKGVVSAKLRGGGGSLTVRTGAPDATVLVEGAPATVGEELHIDHLDRGRYEISVERPGFKSASVEITMGGGGRQGLRAELIAEGQPGRSELVPVKPLTQRWTFWTAVGVSAAGLTTGGILLAAALEPEPIPEGDVVVTLP